MYWAVERHGKIVALFDNEEDALIEKKALNTQYQTDEYQIREPKALRVFKENHKQDKGGPNE